MTEVHIHSNEVTVNVFVNDKTFDTEWNQEEKLRESARAEHAVARLLGGRLNTHTGSDDGGYDVTLPDGRRVDVKSSPHTHLVIPSYQQHRADLYVFVRLVDDETVDVKGYVTAEDLSLRPTTSFCKTCGTPCAKKAPGMVFHEDELKPMEYLTL
jgi:hypothetical protein